MNRNLHRATLRFPRTAAEAFRDHTYGAAIERPAPRRPLAAVWIVFAIAAAMLVAACSRSW